MREEFVRDVREAMNPALATVTAIVLYIHLKRYEGAFHCPRHA
jgi:hypothetical protein